MQQPMDFANPTSNLNLERHYLERITDESAGGPECAPRLAQPCVEPAKSTWHQVDALRAALVTILDN
jgi:hypothetical protein